MDTRNITHQRIAPNTGAAMDPTEDLPPDVDEPPDERGLRPQWTSAELHFATSKVDRSVFNRRESLLTRQLHSETEHTDDDNDTRAPPRTLSTQSTWSNPSVASTAELTSDDGHSVASPAISPPLPPTAVKVTIPIMEKPLAREPHILGQEDKVPETGSEKSVEAGLGRKRCISFACGNKDKKPPTSQPVPPPAKKDESASSASPPKRKCMLKFVCPSRPTLERKSSEKSMSRRPVSPPPPERKASASAKSEAFKAHRGSDSTVTHASPKSSRKSPAIVMTAPTPTTTSMPRRKLSNESDASTEATRFHEFASSDGEPEEWVQESTCHRSRLTVSDTLKKENILRKACEEVEEEVVEEEEEEEAEMEDDEDDEDDDDDDEDQDEEEESDDGFRTDDEEGFAESDSEGEESDGEWWRPGGISTAATSIDHLERLTLNTAKDDPAPSSSVASADSSHISPRAIKARSRRKHHSSHAVPIKPRSEPMDLPDSTDFVCGTLDEDRPLEQAFLNQLKMKEAAKHKARPQDIDPTFPTSDPEMDEEDDEDLEDSESERENLMHGDLDELDGDFTARHRTASPRTRTRSNSHRSPPPPRHRSPAPPRHRSPPPPRHRSPAPAALKRQGTARSPPPPSRRGTARSPPPRKLFGQSPKRSRSPAPKGLNMTSPPNTRRSSPVSSAIKIDTHVLASRPQLTHTASLPRGGFKLGKLSKFHIDHDDGSDTERNTNTGDVPKRGAIDIYKGLEKKRQRRKEKLYQKMCAKAAAKGEKAYKVKPGKGAERMRELGLELQRYHGKGEHILSM